MPPNTAQQDDSNYMIERKRQIIKCGLNILQISWSMLLPFLASDITKYLDMMTA